MSYTLPSDVDARPVTVVGAGTLGRRIAAMFGAGGTDVRIFDLSAEQRAAAVDFATGQAPGIRRKLSIEAPRTGAVEAVADLPHAVDRAWMVIEAVPERRDLKIEVLGALDRLAGADAILASNSSSFATGELIDKVEHAERVLNTHDQMPPDLNAVELMSDGSTDENIIGALMARLP
jgi:3-hydroxybutyryl-CoA dehydrogenase